MILMYHRVRKQKDWMFPAELDAETFDRHMALLRRHCSPLPLTEAIAALRHNTLPPRAVAVTFDDGYADNATVALPILQCHRIHATFFIATEFLDGGCMWNDRITETVRRVTQPSLNLSDLGLGVEPLGDEARRGQLAERIIGAVKHLHPTERLEKVETLVRNAKTRLPADLMMSSNQVRQLAQAGMDVGAHTVSHPILLTLSKGEAIAEIAGSKRALEDIIGRPVHTFAYPNGRIGHDYTVRDRDLVAAQGFDFAVSTNPGVVMPGSDVFQLPRFTPWGRTQAQWLAKLLLAFGGTLTHETK